ncbi:MAG: SDR family oxidoreductase, partial [Planctomycetota bacterium]
MSDSDTRVDSTLSIRETLADKTVFITGGTGFLGKVVLGKLLTLCPELGGAILLVRPKKGITAQERLANEVLNSPVLSEVEPSALPRIEALEGDASNQYFGRTEAEWEALCARVDVVVHIAGVVDFSPPLGDALSVNVYGTRTAIALAKAAGAPLLHTSTCFVSGCRDGRVEETAILGDYPAREQDGPLNLFLAGPEVEAAEALVRHAEAEGEDASIIARFAQEGDPSQARRLARKHARRRIRQMGKERAQRYGFPNTYTYTKAIAEQLVLEAREEGVDAVIVRPAILESANRFPEPGWNQGANTSAPLIYMMYRGHAFFPLDIDHHLDILPIDMCGGAMVAIAAALVAGEADPCYQIGSGDTNRLVNRRSVELAALYFRNKPVPNFPLWLSMTRRRLIEPRNVTKKAYQRSSLPMFIKATSKARGALKGLLGGSSGGSLISRGLKAVEKGLDGAERAFAGTGKVFDEFMPFTA